jgi:dephospho-CoA kinase
VIYTVGLTGGIGSGKTTVSRMFQALGIPVFNADAEARILQETDPTLIAEMMSLLGDECFNESGQLDRKKTSEKVFSNRDLLIELNKLVHPRVFKAWQDWKTMQDSSIVMRETALLMHEDSSINVNALVVVEAPEADRIARVMQRDGVNEDAVVARMRAQKTEINPEIAHQLPVLRINNDGRQSLLQSVTDIYAQLKNYAGSQLKPNH